jgi:hypothetical protein
MPPARKRNEKLAFSEINPGAWRGEILGSCTVNFGLVVQKGPTHRHCDENRTNKVPF